MKITVDIDLTPEELRQFMGLPDVQGLQKQMFEQFSDSLLTTQDSREEFMRNILTGAVSPWLNFFNPLQPTPPKKDD